MLARVLSFAWQVHKRVRRALQTPSSEAVIGAAVASFAPARHEVRGAGPKVALERMVQENVCPQKRIRWAESARVDALLGSCPRSHNSMMSGVRCWSAFAQRVLDRTGREFPPTANDLVAWSRLFRCHGTFGNYLGHVRLGCQVLCVSDAVCVYTLLCKCP